MEPFFLTRDGSQRFCLFHAAAGKAKGAILYIHPFAEEMNKARRMAALQSRSLANAGYDVLQIDLLGCGDSSGDFGDANWQAWQDDVIEATHALRQRSQAPLTLWGMRAGCLLAAAAATRCAEPVDFIFWQPVISGKMHWQQFMRLKIAGEVASGLSKSVGEALRQQLAAGEPVEIAGYTVAPALVRGLEGAELLPPAHAGRVIWLEVSLRDVASIAPVSQKCISTWQAAGYRVDARVANGPAFWQTTEIEDAPQLLAATLAALEAES